MDSTAIAQFGPGSVQGSDAQFCRVDCAAFNGNGETFRELVHLFQEQFDSKTRRNGRDCDAAITPPPSIVICEWRGCKPSISIYCPKKKERANDDVFGNLNFNLEEF